ncbi:MAG: VWA domain-containing protein [Chloroflexota bacterium]|nr:VWA domain-containing protein [Chloroflexota bacterium]
MANQLLQNEVTHVIFILDRSGSMAGHEADVIGGVNAYVEGLRTAPGAVGISYVRFDNVAELVWNDVALADVPAMTSDDFLVRGSTALLDAIGKTISAVNARDDHTYIVIIHTDGHENASTEWTKKKVRALLKERTQAGNWTFLFFGQDIDAWAEAADAGFAAGNVKAYGAAERRGRYRMDSRMTSMMRAQKIRSTQHWSAASDAAERGASDEEVIQILKGEQSGRSVSDDPNQA